jgi:hypothetical protein
MKEVIDREITHHDPAFRELRGQRPQRDLRLFSATLSAGSQYLYRALTRLTAPILGRNPASLDLPINAHSRLLTDDQL